MDERRIRKEKVADSKISGYVWTGPTKPYSEPFIIIFILTVIIANNRGPTPIMDYSFLPSGSCLLGSTNTYHFKHFFKIKYNNSRAVSYDTIT